MKLGNYFQGPGADLLKKKKLIQRLATFSCKKPKVIKPIKSHSSLNFILNMEQVCHLEARVIIDSI